MDACDAAVRPGPSAAFRRIMRSAIALCALPRGRRRPPPAPGARADHPRTPAPMSPPLRNETFLIRRHSRTTPYAEKAMQQPTKFARTLIKIGATLAGITIGALPVPL